MLPSVLHNEGRWKGTAMIECDGSDSKQNFAISVVVRDCQDMATTWLGTTVLPAGLCPLLVLWRQLMMALGCASLRLWSAVNIIDVEYRWPLQ